MSPDDLITTQIESLLSLKESLKVQESVYQSVLQDLEPIVKGNYARRVIITGVGKNSNIASKASETFASLGVPSLALNASHYSHGDAGYVGPDDFVVMISRSGKTDEILFMASHLAQIRPNVKTLLLHCNDNLPEDVKDKFTYVLGVSNVTEADKNALAPTSSTTVLLVLLDCIGTYLSSVIKFTPKDFYSYHPGGSLGNMLKGQE